METEAPKSMSKSQLVAELATGAGLSKAAIGRILDDLANVVYRETPKGFTVPGICKLSVSHRRARRSRNPKTGQALMIGAHDVVTVKALKKARDLIAPTPEGLVTIAIEETAATPAPGTHAEPEPELQISSQSHTPPAAVNTPEPQEAAELWFQCPSCSAEITCPASNAGEQASCPACKCGIIIPNQTGGVAKRAEPVPPPLAPPKPKANEVTIVLFRCPECSQEIEAPADVAGQSAECPACGIILRVPVSSDQGIDRAPHASAVQKAKETNTKEQLSRTIRIDLDEVFK